jgi:hypothetical protein
MTELYCNCRYPESNFWSKNKCRNCYRTIPSSKLVAASNSPSTLRNVRQISGSSSLPSFHSHSQPPSLSSLQRNLSPKDSSNQTQHETYQSTSPTRSAQVLDPSRSVDTTTTSFVSSSPQPRELPTLQRTPTPYPLVPPLERTTSNTSSKQDIAKTSPAASSPLCGSPLQADDWTVSSHRDSVYSAQTSTGGAPSAPPPSRVSSEVGTPRRALSGDEWRDSVVSAATSMGGVPPAPPPSEIGDSPDYSDDDHEGDFSNAASSTGSDRRGTSPDKSSTNELKRMRDALVEVEHDKFKFNFQRAALEILRLNDKNKQLVEEVETLKKQNSELAHQNAALSNDIQQLKELNKTLTERNNDLERENKRLKELTDKQMQTTNKLKTQFETETEKQSVTSNHPTTDTTPMQESNNQTQSLLLLSPDDDNFQKLKSNLNHYSLSELQQLQMKHTKILLKIQKAIENKRPKEMMCLHCGQNPRSHAWDPCGHYNTCQICAKELNSCPQCRTQGKVLQIIE